MDLITLYRVQHPELKCGPWNTHVHGKYSDFTGDKELVEAAREAVDKMVWLNPGYLRSHPTASSDIRGWTEEYVCAVKSLDMLKSWFRTSDAINALFDAGFTVIMVKVDPDYVKESTSGTQMGYDPFGVKEEVDLGLLTLVE